MWKNVKLFSVRIYIKQLHFCGNCLQTEAWIRNVVKTHIPSPTSGTSPDHHDLSNNQE